MVLRDGAQLPCVVSVSEGTEVGQLLRAEKFDLEGTPDLHASSWLNTPIPLMLPLEDKQVIFVREQLQLWNQCPFTDSAAVCRPDLSLPSPRIEALYRQQAWVARDEMEYYLSATSFDHMATAFPPACYHNEIAVKDEAHHWLSLILDSIAEGQKWCSAAIVNGHWIPLVLHKQAATITMYTTPEGTCFLETVETLVQDNSMTFSAKQSVLPQSFPADCGFQSFAWIIAILSGLEVQALSCRQAAKWRQLFANELLRHETAWHIAHHLDLGGARPDNGEVHQLTELLTTHGVWPERSQERAAQIVAKISPAILANILASPRPWQDLKAAANNMKPQLRLIMADELNAQIANRTSQRKYGRKSDRQTARKPDATKEVPSVQASELQVPHGVFRQQDGTVLSSLHVNEVGPQASGVLLLDQEDCEATLRLPQPVSKGGLAVIVLATKHNANMHQMPLIRFPAMCLSTQEPLITAGYMYQLGSQQVVRHDPPTKLAVEEQPTEVVRCVVFRDQAMPLWDSMLLQPVKHIFQAEPLLTPTPGEDSVVIDVWDRQWVTKKYEKVRPTNADMFLCSIRMQASQAETLLTKSGQNGVYWEPRSHCGRYPNDSYHVTWLQKMTLQDAKYAQQTSPQTTTLVRHGDRYGLRSDTMVAQEIHSKHRPDTPLLLGQNKLLFTVGPLPYSTTKTALMKILKAWDWDARPLQPKGRAPDGSGITWIVQAVEPPTHLVYALQHGDVLVAHVQDAKPQAKPEPFAIIASKKTIDHLQSADPWLHDDPWRKGPAPNSGQPAKQQPSSHVSPTAMQLDKLEASLESKIIRKLTKQDGDVAMETNAMDSRISQLEHQFQQLQAMQSGTDAKVSQLQQHVEQQNKCLGEQLDTRLAEHMDRIEQLLCKRGRHE